ncbi:MAG: alanine--tRNA ligase [Candidatus Blackburnbacteria bacterium]|nr:alanine--tRNA ligase [Candidatus Blackburnbacteria bacterium]
MTSKEIRSKYLKFFEKRGHRVIPYAPLVPKDDPTTLFITAGMQPLVPFLLGEEHSEGKRLVNIQPCLRTDDIDEVGDNTHNTFLEMLGNWSLGDYWKKESIAWSLEFLTQELELPKEKLAVTIFAGDADAPKDDESFSVWKDLGIPEDRICALGKKDNWWGPVGNEGPCGPDTEIFYWTGKGDPLKVSPSENNLWVEVWNNVFMEYNKTFDGKYEPLKQKNVDTGMGLERISAVVQGKTDVYETDLFGELYRAIEEKAQSSEIKSIRIIADHTRASVFLIANGVEPANSDRGYILRRLIRRAVRAAYRSGIHKGFFPDLAKIVIDQFSEFYPELKENEDKIYEVLNTEEERFQKPINWVELYRQDLEVATGKGVIKKIGNIPIVTDSTTASGTYVFENYQTYGVPPDLAEDVVRELGMGFDKEGFESAMREHQSKSRTAAAGKFSGGLADHSESVVKGHTATHLLHQALREVLGDEVAQTGSNITPERVRFDFKFNRKLTDEEIKKVEEIVNEKIAENLAVSFESLPLEEARKTGAIGLFAEKYLDRVKVYSIGPSTRDAVRLSSPSKSRSGSPFSREFCGGPHVTNTGEIGHVTITKEESAGSGIRRIYATIELESGRV